MELLGNIKDENNLKAMRYFLLKNAGFNVVSQGEVEDILTNIVPMIKSRVKSELQEGYIVFPNEAWKNIYSTQDNLLDKIIQFHIGYVFDPAGVAGKLKEKQQYSKDKNEIEEPDLARV